MGWNPIKEVVNLITGGGGGGSSQTDYNLPEEVDPNLQRMQTVGTVPFIPNTFGNKKPFHNDDGLTKAIIQDLNKTSQVTPKVQEVIKMEAMPKITNEDQYKLNLANQEQDVINLLRNRLDQNTPSLASMQLQTGREGAIKDITSMLGSQRGVPTGLASRAASLAGADVMAQTNEQAAKLRAMEEQQKIAQYADYLAGARARALGLETSQNQLQTQRDIATQQMEFQRKEDWKNRLFGLAGSLGTAGALYAASDENLKENIKESDNKAYDFIKNLKSYSYNYKNKKTDGSGSYVSPMAQDLEKTEIGKDLVINTPRGKMVDYGKAFGAMVSATSEMARKIEKLENKRA